MSAITIKACQHCVTLMSKIKSRKSCQKWHEECIKHTIQPYDAHWSEMQKMCRNPELKMFLVKVIKSRVKYYFGTKIPSSDQCAKCIVCANAAGTFVEVDDRKKILSHLGVELHLFLLLLSRKDENIGE